MRCFICNAVIDEPVFNNDHQDIDPCDICKYAIEDILAGYGDSPAAPDDEGLDPVLLEELYPTIEDVNKFTCDPCAENEESP